MTNLGLSVVNLHTYFPAPLVMNFERTGDRERETEREREGGRERDIRYVTDSS
jgi:hypothetical protein